MKVTLQLCLTRTVAIDVDSNLNDLGHLVQQLESPHQESIHSMKIVEVNGQNVGTSLDTNSALGVSKDQKVARFHQLVPALLQKLRQDLSSKLIPSIPSQQRRPMTKT